MSQSNKHLFLFTLGPVQSFIAQARKTQDLYAGSKLLSELIKEAIETIGQDNVIFPYVKGKNLKTEIDSLPNRFIAEIDKPESELAQLGKDVEDVVIDKFKQIADDIFNDLVKPTEKNFRSLYDKFSRQITQHLDIHWLFLKCTNNYAKDFAEIEQLLGAIKNVRTIEQNEETGRKCSIDGERNALFCAKGSRNSLQLKPNWDMLNQPEKDAVNDFNSTLKEIYKGNLNKNEGLSAVSLLKRLYKDEEEDFKRFPSTAEIALMNDVKDFTPEELDIFDCFQKLFSKDKFPEACLKMFSEDLIKSIKINDLSKNEDWNTHFDHQLLFEDNINDKTIPDKQQLKLAKILFSKIQKKLKTKYYALIAFDADSMGEWLSGNKIKDNLKEFHKKLSQKLLDFGKWATEYLTAPLGKTVYAGGDDFLGFVNLKHLFEVMKELRSQFDTIVNCAEVTQFINGADRLSFSAGIVIAHYKMPLGEVLTWAKKMEHEAKELDKNKKDAFAIAVLKKSGEVIQAKSKWKKTNNYVTDLLENIYNELSDEETGFSATFIKNLNKEFSIFDSENNYFENPSCKNGVITTEIKRLIGRSCLSKDNKKSKIDTFSNTVKELYQVRQDTEAFLETLSVCDFLTRKITQD